MSVLPMKRILICAMKEDRKGILELLQRAQVVEVDNTLIDDSQSFQDNIFSKIDVSASSQLFQKNADAAEKALEILNHVVPEKTSLLSSLEGRRVISGEEYSSFVGKREEIMSDVTSVINLDKELSEANAEIPRIETQLEGLTPWLTLDVPLSFKGTKKTAAFIGSLPSRETEETLLQRFAVILPEIGSIDIELISSSDEITCFVVICSKNDVGAVDDALRRMNFSRPPMSDEIPSKQKENLDKRLAETHAEIDTLTDRIAAFELKRDSFKFIYDYLHMRSEKYDIISTLEQSHRTFVLTGFIPEKECAALEKTLTASYNLCLEFEEPEEEDDVPVLLQNNGFATPVESVVESYSLPSKGELDPSMAVACSYYILFGMMLSDAAYGAIMSIATGILLKKFKNMEAGMRKVLTMFFFCGIGTVISGVLFGSYFGDAPAVISKVFFGNENVKVWYWIDPLNQPMKMLVVSFAIGIIHMFSGLGINLYTAFKQHRYLDGIYDSVFWYMLVGGLVVFALTADMITSMFQLPMLPAIYGKIGAYVAAAGGIGIILTGGRESKNWFKRILKGLYSLYNVTGYLSDILSYSRLLALGLATSVISSVFNQMGSMFGNSIIGVILFIIIFLIGHALNMAINALGAYVHTNRLEFVEFFGKFYSGGGRKFAPFAVNTKYFKFKEEL